MSKSSRLFTFSSPCQPQYCEGQLSIMVLEWKVGGYYSLGFRLVYYRTFYLIWLLQLKELQR